MTFLECVKHCAEDPEFVSNWARLRGVRLPVSPIDSMIDAATGHGDAIARMFLEDVADLVWARLKPNA